MSNYLIPFISLIITGVFTVNLYADNDLNTSDNESFIRSDSPHYRGSGWDVSLGAGVVVTTEDLYVGGDENKREALEILLEASYQNGDFYVLASDKYGFLSGYTLWRKDDWVFDTVLAPKISRSENDVLEQLDERHIDFHLGLRLSGYGKNNRLSFEASRDISGAHEGSLISVEYLHELQLRNWILTGGVGFLFASDKMTNYYFGVEEDEANARFPAYQANKDWLVLYKIIAEYPINERWIFSSSIVAAHFGSEVGNSPVTENNSLSYWSAGVRYRF